MAGAEVIDFSEYRGLLDQVFELLKGRAVLDGGERDLVDPGGAFLAVAEAFDNYRETYVRRENMDDALLALAVTTIYVRQGLSGLASKQVFEVGGYKLRVMEDGNIWIESPDGDGGEFSLGAVIDGLDRLFADNF